jgi:type I restriction enzyme R subunit
MLENTIKKYTNRSIETAEVIQELIDLAKKMKEEADKGKDLNLGEDEVAFYDALMVNDSAVKVLGDDILRKIAIELTETIHNNVTIDWTLRESVQAKLRLMVKKVLKKYNYPPDKQEAAIRLVLEQAQVIGKDWIVQN